MKGRLTKLFPYTQVYTWLLLSNVRFGAINFMFYDYYLHIERFVNNLGKSNLRNVWLNRRFAQVQY